MTKFDSNWSYVSDGDLLPKGFSFAGISAKLKESTKRDLALIIAPENAICSGFFTQSNARASCVDLCEKRLEITQGKIRAILINSGQANACTGQVGIEHSLFATKRLGELLNFKEEQILICSTGVIGVPIPINNLVANLPHLISGLDMNSFTNASEAILTTDLVSKRSIVKTIINGRSVVIAGMAKGSGMIYPNMATMLAFLTCDVKIEKEYWDQMIHNALSLSFNAISVDGETSTNDSFLAINAGDEIDNKFLPIIQQGLNRVCEDLAKSIARDGEGANCLLEVAVEGTQNDLDAIKVAKSICNSSLVKTAIHGCDPNWGRIISAVGNSGVKFDFSSIDLMIGQYLILEKGKIKKFDKEEVSKYIQLRMNARYLIDDTVSILLRINQGTGKGKAWGCDLSKRYIEINSEYTT